MLTNTRTVLRSLDVTGWASTTIYLVVVGVGLAAVAIAFAFAKLRNGEFDRVVDEEAPTAVPPGRALDGSQAGEHPEVRDEGAGGDRLVAGLRRRPGGWPTGARSVVGLLLWSRNLALVDGQPQLLVLAGTAFACRGAEQAQRRPRRPHGVELACQPRSARARTGRRSVSCGAAEALVVRR